MQIVMYGGIDGRYVKCMMQVYESGCENVAQNPGEKEREQCFLPTDRCSGRVEMKNQRIETKEQHQRYERKDNFAHQIYSRYFRKQNIFVLEIKDGNEFREVDQQRNRHRNDNSY